VVESNKRLALRGAALSFRGDPFIDGDEASLHYEADGLILIENGVVTAFGDYQVVKTQLRDHNVKQFTDALILPGFIDTHVHYPQTQMTALMASSLSTG